MSSNNIEEQLNVSEVTRASKETLPKENVVQPIETAEGEKTLENAPIQTEKKITTNNESDKPKLRLPTFRKPKLPLPRTQDEVTIKIEKIMSDNLIDAYQKLSPIAQQEFKIKGEETAQKISQLLKKTHIKVKKIFALLFDWLKMIPGVNYFFLEQEAKIKADKIIALKNHLQK